MTLETLGTILLVTCVLWFYARARRELDDAHNQIDELDQIIAELRVRK